MIKKDIKNFVIILWVLIVSMTLVSLGFLALVRHKKLQAVMVALIVLVIFFAVTAFATVALVIITRRIIDKRRVSKTILKLYSKAIRIMYPLMSILCDLINIDKNSVRRVFSNINNNIVLLSTEPMKPEDIIIITPHCLQLSTCKHKVTGEINNCQLCGACNIDSLLRVSRKYNIKLIVVTGGTLARKIIKDNRPKGIIAVACERDLTHGILDVKGIPVIGIKNERPNGPCVDTKVDVEKVEEAINYFLGGVKWQ